MKEHVIYLSISSDARLIIYSTPLHFRVLNIEGLLPVVGEDAFGGMRHAMALHANSPLFLMVPSGDKPGTSPRRLKIWNNQKRELIKELTFTTNIEGLQWNKQHIAVLLESNELQLFDLRTLKLRVILQVYPKAYTFALTPSLTSAIPFIGSSPNNDVVSPIVPADISASTQVHYLVFPTPGEKGCVSIFNCEKPASSSSSSTASVSSNGSYSPTPPKPSFSMKLVNKFQAHRTEIAILACDPEGKRVVTASQMGTIVRVFSLPAGEILYSFRIAALSVEIKSFHFCPRGHYLLVIAKNGHAYLCPMFPKKEREKVSTTSGKREAVRDPVKAQAAEAAEEALLANGIDLEISEEDGYCKIDLEEEGEIGRMGGRGEEDDGEEEGQGGYYYNQHNGGTEGDGEEEEGAGGYYREDGEDDAMMDDMAMRDDDEISVLTDDMDHLHVEDDRTVRTTHTTRTSRTAATTGTSTTIRAPAADAKIPNAVPPSSTGAASTGTGSDSVGMAGVTGAEAFAAVNQASQQVLSGILDQGSSIFSSWWSVANKQNVVDLTLAGIQKVKTLSQDIFNNADGNTAVAGAEDGSNGGTTAGKGGNSDGSGRGRVSNNHRNSNMVHLELDREIRHPILHCHCLSPSFNSSSSSSSKVPTSVCVGPGHDEVAVSLVYVNPRSSTRFTSSPITAWEENSANTGDHDNQTVGTTVRMTRQNSQSMEELKLLVITKEGLLRRIDLTPFQYQYYRSPQRTNQHALDYYVSPTLTATVSHTIDEMMKYVEDERSIFD